MLRYKMLARDVNSSPTQYRTWVAGTPDLSALTYTGYKSGENAFVDTVAYLVTDPSAVVDFNLPNPRSWDTTRNVLPEAVSDSQLAVIDGYVYLFGGKDTNKILRATVQNPAQWTDTGSTLPQRLYGSQLAVADGYVYLFGGVADGYTTNNVYSATTTNPLVWTNHGPVMPNKISHSQLLILDGYMHLLGGLEINLATNKILTAPVTSPLSWTFSGQYISSPLYGSQVGIIDGYAYLFGGQLSDHSQTADIFRAPLSNIANWSMIGALPYPASNGQFIMIGNDGYLFTTVNSGGGRPKFTSILMCHSSSPAIWINTGQEIPGEISFSQLAIIYDRLFLFGGNGSSIIFASNPDYRYLFDNPDVFAYGNRSRTVVNATVNPNDLFKNIGFPPWKSDY